MQVILGGLITIAVVMIVEYVRRPVLRLRIDGPIDLPYSSQHPAQQARFVRVLVENHALPWAFRWMARNTASFTTATVSFHHLDGQNLFGRQMTGRWSGSPEPVPSLLVLGNQHGQVWDIGRLTAPQRMDIPVGAAEPVDVAGRFDNDPECYGWNNEAYFSQPHWRNPKWRLPHGRFLVKVVVNSQGETTEGTFRLVNDVARSDFRLELAMPDDLAQ